MSCLINALSPFNINNYLFASDKQYSYSISETIRVWIRPQGSAYPKEISENLFEQINLQQQENSISNSAE